MKTNKFNFQNIFYFSARSYLESMKGFLLYLINKPEVLFLLFGIVFGIIF